MLIKWTQAELEKVRDTPQRVERARNALESVGGELKANYFAFGRYDVTSIVEAPSDEAMAKVTLTIGKFGTVSLKTLKAFSEAHGYEIIKGLP